MRFVIRIIVLVCLVFSIFFGYMALKEYQPIAIAKKKIEVLRENVVEDKEMDEITKSNFDMKIEKIHPLDREIDFSSLKKMNTDIIGWIFIPDTSVDYPVLIGDTDDKYLNKDFEGKDSKLGSIFSYADTDKELEDARTILFGHNMKNKAMFGELKRYVQENSFRKEHRKMYVYTEKCNMELEIFSIFVCENTDEILRNDVHLGSLEYQEVLRKLSKRNEFLDIEKESIVKMYHNPSFTLVTCWGRAGSTRRLVVHGIVTKEELLKL